MFFELEFPSPSGMTSVATNFPAFYSAVISDGAGQRNRNKQTEADK
jgi:hypothetical protein